MNNLQTIFAVFPESMIWELILSKIGRDLSAPKCSGTILWRQYAPHATRGLGERICKSIIVKKVWGYFFLNLFIKKNQLIPIFHGFYSKTEWNHCEENWGRLSLNLFVILWDFCFNNVINWSAKSVLVFSLKFLIHWFVGIPFLFINCFWVVQWRNLNIINEPVQDTFSERHLL